MICKGKRRKDVVDNNNYIRKIGQITFVCPKCGNLYQVSGELNAHLHLEACPLDVEGYSITTPTIKKECNCGAECIQVDNLMGIIVKNFIDKGYNVLSCCEGHAYNEDGILSYDFPSICIDGTIKSMIPIEYLNKLLVYEDFGKTIITCGNSSVFEDGVCPCASLEQYNTYKMAILAYMESLAKGISKLNISEDSSDNFCPMRNCNYGQ